jgi:hypothetical protein
MDWSNVALLLRVPMLKFIKAISAFFNAANEMNRIVSQLQSNNLCHDYELRAELLQATKEMRASRMERMLGLHPYV